MQVCDCRTTILERYRGEDRDKAAHPILGDDGDPAYGHHTRLSMVRVGGAMIMSTRPIEPCLTLEEQEKGKALHRWYSEERQL